MLFVAGMGVGLFAGISLSGRIKGGEQVHPDDRDAIAQAKARAFLSGVSQIIGIRRRERDGSWRWHQYQADPSYPVSVDVAPIVHGPGDAWTIASSLGETASAVNAAKVIENLCGAAFAFDTDGEFTYATPMAQTSIAMTLDDLNAPLGGGRFIEGGDLGWKTGVHPDDYEGAATELRRCMRAGEPFNYEYRVLRAGGNYVGHRFAIRPARDVNGQVTGWYGIGFDIDVFRKTDDALRESERSLRELIETAPALIWCMAPDGEPVYFSRRLRDFFGFDVAAKDLPGIARLECILQSVIHPDDLAKVRDRFANSLRTGKSYALTHRQRRFDGVYRWVETRIAAMRGEDGAIAQWNGVCLDIDDQVRAQEELRLTQENLARAREAASLAELSASVAHEVNQPLAAIMANAQACRRWLAAEPPNVERAQSIVERIAGSAQSAADIVSHIRALFSRNTGPRLPSALGELIGEVRDLLADELARCGVALEIEMVRGIPHVEIDRVQIQQVLVNILRNAMQAMLTVDVDRRELRVELTTVPGGVQIEVADTGPGLSSSENAFEPFFTTKAEGMGMGLAISRSIVEAHGGRLWVEKNIPVGARFVFTLPASPGLRE
ncbi:hypothetical protein GCM10011349_29420 [Novosphingobium indicum]|uniref:histidine kinase n=1 Tax=Novosphingobium indicum TaxID=462949 RepID=A0ABQ2JRX3_9SPHN|nr:hypothetical protein GCM10011349_29420 [Novosphingobium indicum]